MTRSAPTLVLSNNQRAHGGKRRSSAKRAAGQRKRQAKDMTGLRIQLDRSKQTVGRGAKVSVGVKVSGESRIFRSPTDIIRPNMMPPTKEVEYGLAYWMAENAKRLPHNPNRLVPNVTTVRVREFSEKLGRVITKSARIAHGGFYRKPAHKLTMLGPECLFDDCQELDNRHWSDGDPYRIQVKALDEVAGKIVTRTPIAYSAVRTRFHLLVGDLPPWKDSKPRVDYAKLARDKAVHEWKAERMRRVQEWVTYLDYLGVAI